MIVLDVLKDVSLYLNLTDNFAPLLTGSGSLSEENKLEFEKILLSINNVNRSLSSKIAPLKNQEIVLIENNKFDLSLLKKNLNYICCVKDISSFSRQKFNVFDLELNTNFSGLARVEYFYFPPKVVDENSPVERNRTINDKTFVLGVIAEYCFINGLFDDAEIWESRFLAEIDKNFVVKKSFELPKKRWV